MKANRIPLSIRLQRRIEGLEWRLLQSRERMDKIHGSHGNPYWGCKGCGRADPQLSYDGHAHSCRFKSLEGEIRYYRNQLASIEKKP